MDESVPRIDTKKQNKIPIQSLACSPSFLVSPSYQKLKYTRRNHHTTVPPRLPEDAPSPRYALTPDELEFFGPMEQRIQHWSTVEDPKEVQRALLKQALIAMSRLNLEKQR